MRKNKPLPDIKYRKVPNIFPEIKREDIEEAADKSILNITNTSSRYQLQYGKEFRDFLEARDQVL